MDSLSSEILISLKKTSADSLALFSVLENLQNINIIIIIMVGRYRCLQSSRAVRERLTLEALRRSGHSGC